MERKRPERIDLAVLKKIKPYSNTAWPYVWYPGFINVTGSSVNEKNKTLTLSGSSVGRNTKIFIAAKRNNFMRGIESLKKTAWARMMGTYFFPVVAAELRLDSLFNSSVEKILNAYFKAPFYALTETPDNRNYNFISGAGAFLQQAIFVYTGLRLTDEGLVKKFKPILPAGVSKLTLRNFKFRGRIYNYVVQNGKLNVMKK